MVNSAILEILILAATLIGNTIFDEHITDAKTGWVPTKCGIYALGHLDQNKNIDYISVSYDTLSIFLNISLGTSQVSRHGIGTKKVSKMLIRDINNDGVNEIIIGGKYDDCSLVWYSFKNQNIVEQGRVNYNFLDLTDFKIYDMNNDGFNDIIGCDELTVLYGSSTMQFTPHQITINKLRNPFVLCDMNGDSLADIVVCTFPLGTIDIYENKGPAGFQKHLIDSNLVSVGAFDAADFNGDKKADIVCALYGFSKITTYSNHGSFQYVKDTIAEWKFPENRYGIDGLKAVDLDYDLDFDIIANSDQSEIIWYENAQNQFSKHVINPSLFTTCSNDYGDADNDGDIDVFTFNAGDNSLRWYENKLTPELIFPDSNVTRFAGCDTMIIQWKTPYTDLIQIDFSIDNGTTWKKIDEGIFPLNQYRWVIPRIESDLCRLRISIKNDPAYFHLNANPFGSISGKIKLDSTINSWDIHPDNLTTIKWENSCDPGNVLIQYSPNNGLDWITVVDSLTNTGSYQWRIPELESLNNLLKVSSISNPKIYDISKPFLIRKKPYLKLNLFFRVKKGTLTMLLNKKEKISLQIYDMFGRLLQNYPFGEYGSGRHDLKFNAASKCLIVKVNISNNIRYFKLIQK